MIGVTGLGRESYLPPGWPTGVQPPGTEDWEITAVAWLLEVVSECRKYRLVCSHPVVLASISRRLVHGQVEGPARDTARFAPS
jgi:hypothetical protein